jgi:hypothetical protein
MINPGIENALWSELDGRLWHATSQDGLKGILEDGQIRPAVGQRYTGSFCRSLGGVCLFDFGVSAENVEHQLCNWTGWFGHQQNARVAIWLEIDRNRIVDNLIDAAGLRVASRKNLAERLATANDAPPNTQFIPGVEACHRGPISIQFLVGALLVDRHNRNVFKKIEECNGEIFLSIKEFEMGLPLHEEDPIRAALIAGLERAQRRGGEQDADAEG